MQIFELMENISSHFTELSPIINNSYTPIIKMYNNYNTYVETSTTPRKYI